MLTPNVVSGELIESVWGNEIRDRTIQLFATAAERDTQWPAPPTGARCTTLDNHVTYQWDGVSWQVVMSTIDGAYNESTIVAHTGTGLFDVLTMAPPTLPYNTIVRINGLMAFGFSAAVIDAQCEIIRNHDGAVNPIKGVARSPISLWTIVPIHWNFGVAAGISPTFKMRINIVSAPSEWSVQCTAELRRTIGFV